MNYFRVKYDNGEESFIQIEEMLAARELFNKLCFNQTHSLVRVGIKNAGVVVRNSNKIFEVQDINEQGLGNNNKVWEIAE